MTMVKSRIIVRLNWYILMQNLFKALIQPGKAMVEYAMLEHLPIEVTENGYSLAGSGAAIASDEMFLQYKNQKDIKFNLKKFYGGAFGQNGGVPYDLRPTKFDETSKPE